MRRLLRWLCAPVPYPRLSGRPQANPRLIVTERRGLIPPVDRTAD